MGIVIENLSRVRLKNTVYNKYLDILLKWDFLFTLFV